jgi:Domain of unknown function (DUF1876)
MTTTKRWSIDIYIDEHDDETTRAEARLQTPDHTNLKGVGTARRNPCDVNVPEIGDELAVARALTDLGALLLRTTAEDIEDVTHENVRLAR